MLKCGANSGEKCKYLKLCLICRFIIDPSDTVVKVCVNCDRPVCQDCANSMDSGIFCSLNCEKETICNGRLALL